MNNLDLVFNQYKYERPNLGNIKTQFDNFMDIIKKSDSLDNVKKAIDSFNLVRGNFSTMNTLCNIRNTINTVDEFYEKEKEWFNDNDPNYSAIEQKVLESIINCKFNKELKNYYGKQWFNLIEISLKVFDESIIEDLQLENKLTTKYQKLKASAKIDFDGKVLNLAQMTPYTTSIDRTTRKKAEDAVCSFYSQNEEEFDTIYDELVHVRDKMAKKLGFNNYVELGYLKMMRTDYDYKMVEGYRKQVLDDLVGVVCELQNMKSKRLGIEDLKSYDIVLNFLSGNPTPKGNKDWLVENAKKMYSEMSKETKEFFDYMVSHQLMDLESKPNKAMGGYCDFLYDYKSPFIFSNFNGTSGDVDVLTHEAGHAFQVYCSLKTQSILEYMFPTYEACEIHSMSMEFFAWPWMKLFFKEDTLKYYYEHLAESICFIPYGVSVDEFQYEVYSNPLLTKKERKDLWRNIEKKYMPYKVYENDFLNKGGFWYRQGHIFESPFYYIDYTLAQICAHQFWIKDHQNHENAWNDYYNLCLQGGKLSFLELLKVANLKNPFEDGTVKYVVSELMKFLRNIDEEKLK